MTNIISNGVNKKILFIVGSVIVLAALFMYGRQGSIANQNNPNVEQKDDTRVAGSTVLVPEETSYDFGQISMAKGKVSHMFNVKNTSDQPVNIKKIYTSCMCTTAYLKKGETRSGPFGMPGHGGAPSMNEVIAPGETAQVEAIFDPAAHGPAGVGTIQRSVFVETESQGSVELKFSASVTP